MAQHLITIEYCPKCNWFLHAASFAQEFLTSVTEDIQGLILIPSTHNKSFITSVGRMKIFNLSAYGDFPEIKVLKQMVRDPIAPHKPLGHTDTPYHLKS